jgi:translation initiation factor IF-1
VAAVVVAASAVVAAAAAAALVVVAAVVTVVLAVISAAAADVVTVTKSTNFLVRRRDPSSRIPPFFRHRAPILDELMEEHIEVEGKIIAVLAGTMFRVELDNKHVVLATISGKMRKRFVRLNLGDRVKMEMSPYDLHKARITWRIG